MDLGLRGRAALVTAASRGIGLAVADRLAREGADVFLCARGEEALAGAAAAVAAHGTRVGHRAADVSDPVQAAEVPRAAAAALGRLDVLVVNAGGPPSGRFADLDDAAWRAAFELTLMSAVRLVRAALPHLRESKAASVTLISSTSVRQPIPDLVLSNSLRLAVGGLAKSLAGELAPAVRVNTVLPGAISTERHSDLLRLQARRAGVDEEEQAARAHAAIPMGRPGTPQELASVVAFLASSAAAYVTGQTLAVDGGAIRGVF